MLWSLNLPMSPLGAEREGGRVGGGRVHDLRLGLLLFGYLALSRTCSKASWLTAPTWFLSWTTLASGRLCPNVQTAAPGEVGRTRWSINLVKNIFPLGICVWPKSTELYSAPPLPVLTRAEAVWARRCRFEETLHGNQECSSHFSLTRTHLLLEFEHWDLALSYSFNSSWPATEVLFCFSIHHSLILFFWLFLTR